MADLPAPPRTAPEFFKVLLNLRVAQTQDPEIGELRAPHKPLLLLMMLSRMRRGEPPAIRFREMQSEFDDLFEKFGPKRESDVAYLPFRHLQSDGLWELRKMGPLRKLGIRALRTKNLRERNPTGGFRKPVVDLLRNTSGLIDAATTFLLGRYFPESCHQDILTAVNLDPLEDPTYKTTFREQEWFTPAEFKLWKLRRDHAQFRQAVLAGYGYRCAICGYHVTMDNELAGLGAAHIKWPLYDGPNQVDNGLALCHIHHHAMDRGWITLNEELNVCVSTRTGSESSGPLFERSEETQAPYLPNNPESQPSQEYLEWHRSEVFRG